MDVEGRHGFWTAMREFAADGKTVIFATHYLEEADAYADRVVLMANGSIVADGPPDRDQGDGRQPHDPGDAARRRVEELERLPGVTRAERRGEAVVLVLRRLRRRDPRLRSTRSRTRGTSRSPAPGSSRPSWS